MVRVGGVEVENITDYASMYRLLAMPSMPHQHYQHTASLQQGAWRYVQREGQRLTVSTARVLQEGQTATYLDDLGVVCVAYSAGGTTGSKRRVREGTGARSHRPTGAPPERSELDVPEARIFLTDGLYAA